MVGLGRGQGQGTAELLAILPTGRFGYAQPFAFLTHRVRQRPRVGCCPPSITEKETKCSQGWGQFLGPRGIRSTILRSLLFTEVQGIALRNAFKQLSTKMEKCSGHPFLLACPGANLSWRWHPPVKAGHTWFALETTESLLDEQPDHPQTHHHLPAFEIQRLACLHDVLGAF